MRTGLVQSNSDLGVIYLMALHFMHGDPSVFYWGQHYGGSLEALTAGALFRIVGPSYTTLQIVMVAYWLTGCLFLRSVVARACGVVAGNVAGALFWVGSPYLIVVTLADPLFYGPGVAIGLGAIWCAQRYEDAPGWQAIGAMGLCLGLALWTTPLSLALVVPAAILAGLRVLRSRSDMRLLAASAVGGLLVGVSPWLWANAQTSFASLHPQGFGGGTIIDRYRHVYTLLVPPLMNDLPGTTRGHIFAALFLLVPLTGLVAAIRRRRTAMVVLCTSALIVPFDLIASGVMLVPGAARYAVFMVPAVAGALGWALGRWRVIAAIAVACVFSWTTSVLWRATAGLSAAEHADFGASTAQLASYLERHGRSAVWADYWESYLLSAATGERIKAAALGPVLVRRSPSYERAAMEPKRTTIVVFAGKANDLALATLPGLPAHERVVLGPFAIWTLAHRFDPSTYLGAIVGP
jgi:hypothetical protein